MVAIKKKVKSLSIYLEPSQIIILFHAKPLNKILRKQNINEKYKFTLSKYKANEISLKLRINK